VLLLQDLVEQTTTLPDVIVGIQTTPAAPTTQAEEITTIPATGIVGITTPAAGATTTAAEKVDTAAATSAEAAADVLTLGNLLKLLLVLGVFGGVFWYIGGARLVARYLPGQVGGNYRKVNRDDPEK
jgi:hypothetical protein